MERNPLRPLPRFTGNSLKEIDDALRVVSDDPSSSATACQARLEEYVWLLSRHEVWRQNLVAENGRLRQLAHIMREENALLRRQNTEINEESVRVHLGNERVQAEIDRISRRLNHQIAYLRQRLQRNFVEKLVALLRGFGNRKSEDAIQLANLLADHRSGGDSLS